MPDRVAMTIDAGVADVRLNRADKMNALDVPMFEALVETSSVLAQESGVRAVVLSGHGTCFSAGLDLESFQKMLSDEDSREFARLTEVIGEDITHFAQKACYGWTELPMPVIAGITGVALGGGVQLALATDIRIIAPEARMSVFEIRWGLTPDMTGTQRLVELVGIDVAKELSFTGRMVDGAEAVNLGLATKLEADPVSAALAMAYEIASKSPEAVRAAKRLFRQASKVSEAEGLAAERLEMAKLIGTPNQFEAVRANLEGRDPLFRDPPP